MLEELREMLQTVQLVPKAYVSNADLLRVVSAVPLVPTRYWLETASLITAESSPAR